MSQLGFDALLGEADAANQKAKHLRETAHLPGTMETALPHYRALLERHHERMLAADIDAVMALREEAHHLAVRLNNGEPGILAEPDSPGYALADLTNAPDGEVPIWGQTGTFMVEVGGMRIRIEFDGLFGIGATFCYWPGFSAHIVDQDKPFLSETGYRCFMDARVEPSPGMTTEAFVVAALAEYIVRECKPRKRRRS